MMMCVFMYTCICLCVHTCRKKPFFFYLLALLSVLTWPLQQKHMQFHLLYSAFYLSIALRQHFPLRSASRPLRLRGLQWLPQ